MTDRPLPLIRALLLTALLTITAGCSHLPQLHWPWHRKTASAPEVVHELVITSPAGADVAFPQYWRGNTLVVDMRLAGGQGEVVLKPREHSVWPVRLAFRVLPAQFGVLEVRAQQRAVLPVTTAGAKPVDLELAPGVYIMKSPQIVLSWGPAAQSSGS